MQHASACCMHVIQPMHQQACVSHHQQVACVETHQGTLGDSPLVAPRGMIMEHDHDLDLQIFRNNPNCNWEVSSSYKLQLPSAALSIPSSPAPQLPKSQVPSPGVPEAVDAVVPAGPRWCCTSSMVITLLCCPTGSTGCPLCPTGVLVDPVAAVLLDLIGCSFVLRRLKLIAAAPE